MRVNSRLKKITIGLNDTRVGKFAQSFEMKTQNQKIFTRFPASPDLHSPSNPTHPIDRFILRFLEWISHNTSPCSSKRPLQTPHIRSINASINTSWRNGRRSKARFLPIDDAVLFLPSPLRVADRISARLKARGGADQHRIPRFSRRWFARHRASRHADTRPDNALTRGGRGMGGRLATNAMNAGLIGASKHAAPGDTSKRACRARFNYRLSARLRSATLPPSSPPFDLSRPLCRDYSSPLPLSSTFHDVRFHSRTEGDFGGIWIT